MILRVVLDTNVVVSALVFTTGRLAWLRAAWQSGRMLPLISRPIARELVRVLAYPKFQLGPDEREDLLADYLPGCEIVPVVRGLRGFPECRDPRDRMFLEIAIAGRADLLVTGDADLLALANSFSVPIVNPEGLRARLDAQLSERAPALYAGRRGKRIRKVVEADLRR